MGRRKSKRTKPPPKKVQKLDTAFECPFCGHKTSVECSIDLKNRLAEATCFTCKQSYAIVANALTDPVDVYAAWIDACEQANEGVDDNGGGGC